MGNEPILDEWFDSFDGVPNRDDHLCLIAKVRADDAARIAREVGRG